MRLILFYLILVIISLKVAKSRIFVGDTESYKNNTNSVQYPNNSLNNATEELHTKYNEKETSNSETVGKFLYKDYQGKEMLRNEDVVQDEVMLGLEEQLKLETVIVLDPSDDTTTRSDMRSCVDENCLTSGDTSTHSEKDIVDEYFSNTIEIKVLTPIDFDAYNKDSGSGSGSGDDDLKTFTDNIDGKDTKTPSMTLLDDEDFYKTIRKTNANTNDYLYCTCSSGDDLIGNLKIFTGNKDVKSTKTSLLTFIHNENLYNKLIRMPTNSKIVFYYSGSRSGSGSGDEDLKTFTHNKDGKSSETSSITLIDDEDFYDKVGKVIANKNDFHACSCSGSGSGGSGDDLIEDVKIFINNKEVKGTKTSSMTFIDNEDFYNKVIRMSTNQGNFFDYIGSGSGSGDDSIEIVTFIAHTHVKDWKTFLMPEVDDIYIDYNSGSGSEKENKPWLVDDEDGPKKWAITPAPINEDRGYGSGSDGESQVLKISNQNRKTKSEISENKDLFFDYYYY